MIYAIIQTKNLLAKAFSRSASICVTVCNCREKDKTTIIFSMFLIKFSIYIENIM